MKKIAVVYWSGSGNTEKMAEALQKNLQELGAEVTLFGASEFDDRAFEEYEAVAFGCPACGDEELDDTEFQPMYDTIRPLLKGKSIALFGSYAWNEGDWMRIWSTQAKEEDGAVLVCEPVICEEAPDDECFAKLEEMAKALV